MTLQTLGLLESGSLTNSSIVGKRMEEKSKKFKFCESEKNFFCEISFFHNFFMSTFFR